ncbi:hypothetical protein DRF62_00310 [Chryseobacterium piscium]|uniref:Uncharacterized protein n=1 Tax=Chryseobacterium piscium TaxID=333702 RepID=A0A3D9BVA6_9FLAO|nr:hypothetical protein [Chryseobacterium piscium]REC57439.1 hypothetical protein DRF62_00310 [Chryseobacterium piscium]
MKSKEELKKLFENGDKPTQENFWEWQDSYWHKDEKLPTDNAGLYKIKGSVADKTALDALTGMSEGDVYNLLDTGANYVYVLDLNNTGEAGWDDFFGTVDLSSINLQTVLENGGTANFSNEYQTAFYAMTQGGFQAQTSNQSGNGSIGLQSTGEFTITRNGIMVNMTDNGLTYQQDYSADFTDRSLVDKAYVDSKVSPATLQSVLDNGNYAVGGVLNTIHLDPNTAFGINYADSVSGSYTSIGGDSNDIKLEKFNGIENTLTRIKLNGGGLLYHEDYSQRPEFGERNLVDKAYVDNAIANSSGGDFIPLTGTEAGKPVTGDIMFQGGILKTPNFSMQIGEIAERPVITTQYANSTNAGSFQSYVEGFEVQLQRNRDTDNTVYQSISMIEGRTNISYSDLINGGCGLDLSNANFNISSSAGSGLISGFLNIKTTDGAIELKHKTGNSYIESENTFVGLDIKQEGMFFEGLEVSPNDSYPVVVIDPDTGKLYYRML